MKIIAISDTHTKHEMLTNKLPHGDLLIHAGDLTYSGTQDEILSVFEWFDRISSNYTYGVVFIAGNHDRGFDPKFNALRLGINSKPEWLVEALHLQEMKGRVRYLENSSTNINGLQIWGSPITPWFHGNRWAFNVHRGPEIAEVWSKIPNTTDIILTHGPVAYKCDHTLYTQEYVGCEDLRKRCKEVKPLLHVCGHIHESFGCEQDEDTVYLNASVCNVFYEPNNKPWEIEINGRELSIV